MVARGKKDSTLYFMHANLSKDVVNTVEKDNTVELWHKRLSHMSEKGIKILGKKNVLSGIDLVHLEKCANCLAEKQNRVTFRSSPPSIMKNVLDLIYSDLYGPMPKSLSCS